MESKCVTDLCKKELKSLESDKVYIALKESITATGRAMVAFSAKDASELSKKDLSAVKVLHKQMTAHIKAKSDIETFNQMRVCTFEKCRKDIDAAIRALADQCKDQTLSKKTCQLLEKKMDAKQVQRALDATNLDVWASWKKDQTDKIMRRGMFAVRKT